MATPPLDARALAAAEAVFNELTELHSLQAGKDISIDERAARGVPEGAMCSLVYGETPFRALGALLHRVQTLLGVASFAGRVFVDLGAGTGKPVFAAALLHPGWRECRGIELVEGLHAASLELQERWEEGLPYFPKGEKKVAHRVPAAARATPVNLVLGDVTAEDWADGDVVFSCSTCFEEPLMAAISARAERLRPGSVVVTCSERLTSPRFGLLEELPGMVMSWGPCDVYVHQRLHDDDGAGAAAADAADGGGATS
jgi:hypothetical protein